MARDSNVLCEMARSLTFLTGMLLLQLLAAERVCADAIAFDEALALSEKTPAVSEARERLEARQSGDEKIRGTADPTTLTFMPGALVSPRQLKGFDMQAAVTQGWNLRGLGGARRDSASHERGVLAATARARALRARLDAARRWIDLATLAHIARNLDERIERAKELVARRERALAAGAGTSQPLTEARAMLAEMRRRRLDLEGDEFAAATQLALATGRAPGPDPLQTTGDAPNPSLPDESEIRSRIAEIETAPDVVVERLRETAARARTIEAAAQYAPVLTLGAQAERSAFDTWVVYGVTGVTFRGPGNQRRLTSIAEAHAASARVQTVDARLHVRAELEEALHDLRHSAAVMKLLDEDMLPALRRLVEGRARAVELGEESYFGLFEARDRELQALEAAFRARGANTWARVHMWLLLAELARGESML